MKKTDLLHSSIVAIALVALALCGCSLGFDSSGKDGESSTATLSVDKTITSVVAGKADAITIKALTAASAKDSVTVASAKGYVTFSDPVYSNSAKTYSLTVTGASGCLGDDTLTVSTGSGLATTVTVKVTDPLALHLDGLLVRFVYSFDYVWDSIEATINHGATFFKVYKPQVPDGYYSLGTYFATSDRSLDKVSVTSDSWRTIVVKDINGSGALAKPKLFIQVGTVKGPGSSDPVLSLYAMIPPTGYCAMGIVAEAGTTAPDLATTNIRCVRKDYIAQASYTTDDRIQNIAMDSQNTTFWLDSITTPSDIDKDDDQLTLNPGLRAFQQESNSNEDILVKCMVLKGRAPVMLAQEDSSYVPTLASLYETEGSARPVYGRRIVALPFFGFNDTLVTTLDKLSHTPVYRIERDYYYALDKFRYNQLSTPYTLELSSTTGVSSSTAQTSWSSKGVEVGPSFGLKIATLTLFKLNKELGFATTTASSEFNQTTVTDTMTIPVGKAGGLFQKRDDLKILRRNNATGLWEDQVGDTLNIVESNIVPDEYPD
jgi:hypothetical protein